MKLSPPFCLVTLCLLSALSGCGKAPNNTKTATNNGDSTSEIPKSTKGGAFSTSLEGYLTELSQGGKGEKFWCKATAVLATAPIAVRSSKVLKEQDTKRNEDYGVVNAKLYTLQLGSSTRGGNPVVKNWLLSMSAEADGQPCIRSLYEQD